MLVGPCPTQTYECCLALLPILLYFAMLDILLATSFPHSQCSPHCHRLPEEHQGWERPAVAPMVSSWGEGLLRQQPRLLISQALLPAKGQGQRQGSVAVSGSPGPKVCPTQARRGRLHHGAVRHSETRRGAVKNIQQLQNKYFAPAWHILSTNVNKWIHKYNWFYLYLLNPW